MENIPFSEIVRLTVRKSGKNTVLVLGLARGKKMSALEGGALGNSKEIAIDSVSFSQKIITLLQNYKKQSPKKLKIDAQNL